MAAVALLAVVLLTPLYIRTAILVDVDPVALAFQPVLLASLASGVLVVSNLTNLLAAAQLSLSNTDFLRHLALPSLAASTIGWFAYRRVFRMGTRAAGWEPDRAPDRRALVVGLGASALPHAFTSLGAGGVRGFAGGAVSANVLNNLLALLVGLTHVSTRSHVWPLLLGVNLGPLLLLTGSLAGLLWQAGARRAGVEIDARRYTRVGAAVGLPAMVAAGLVLRVLG